jgi:hypothetical protein
LQGRHIFSGKILNYLERADILTRVSSHEGSTKYEKCMCDHIKKMDIRLSHVELPATIYEDNILKSLTKK